MADVDCGSLCNRMRRCRQGSDDGAVTTVRDVEPCRLGYEEHDGTRYCFEHGGFAASFIRQMTCDRKPVMAGGSRGGSPTDGRRR